MPSVIAYSAMVCPSSRRQVLNDGLSLSLPLELGIDQGLSAVHPTQSVVAQLFGFTR